jgi:hypothetical protein
MLRLDTLVALTADKIEKSLSTYRPTRILYADESGFYRYSTVVYGGSKPSYSTIWVQDKKPDTLCKVSCTCAYFAMNVETVLVMYGSATQTRANGALPMKRNPKLRPGLCPHLCLLATILLRAWHQQKNKRFDRRNAIDDYVELIEDQGLQEAQEEVEAEVDTVQDESVDAAPQDTMRVNPRLRTLK